MELRARVKYLEEANEMLSLESSRYRMFWMAECRMKGLMEAGHYAGAISQPRLVDSPPERDYDSELESYAEALNSELEADLDSLDN